MLSESESTYASSKLPFANWVTHDQRGASTEKTAERVNKLPRKPDTDLDQFMAAIKWTMERESDAAETIQRLAFRIDGSSKLAERAREHAAELKRVSARLQSYLPKSGAMARKADSVAAKTAILELDQKEASTVLVGYLIQHAEATSEVLSGVGNGLNAKAIEMLCRKVTREKRKIAVWIEKHGAPAMVRH